MLVELTTSPDIGHTALQDEQPCFLVLQEHVPCELTFTPWDTRNTTEDNLGRRVFQVRVQLLDSVPALTVRYFLAAQYQLIQHAHIDVDKFANQTPYSVNQAHRLPEFDVLALARWQKGDRWSGAPLHPSV